MVFLKQVNNCKDLKITCSPFWGSLCGGDLQFQLRRPGRSDDAFQKENFQQINKKANPAIIQEFGGQKFMCQDPVLNFLSLQPLGIGCFVAKLPLTVTFQTPKDWYNLWNDMSTSLFLHIINIQFCLIQIHPLQIESMESFCWQKICILLHIFISVTADMPIRSRVFPKKT